MNPGFSAALMALALVTGACGPSDGNQVRWTLLAPLPPGAVLDGASVTLRAGTSIAARPSVVDPDGGELPCDAQLSSEDTDVLRVDASERGSYALTGNTTGRTTLNIDCGLEHFALSAHVTAAR